MMKMMIVIIIVVSKLKGNFLIWVTREISFKAAMPCCKKSSDSVGGADRARVVSSSIELERFFKKASQDLNTCANKSAKFCEVGSKSVEGVGSSGMGKKIRGKRENGKSFWLHEERRSAMGGECLSEVVGRGQEAKSKRQKYHEIKEASLQEKNQLLFHERTIC